MSDYAFPAYSTNDGMTMHEYFAAKAMQGLLTGTDPYEVGKTDFIKSLVECAYRYADEMIKHGNS